LLDFVLKYYAARKVNQKEIMAHQWQVNPAYNSAPTPQWNSSPASTPAILEEFVSDVANDIVFKLR
jgi:hypothetical protein